MVKVRKLSNFAYLPFYHALKLRLSQKKSDNLKIGQNTYLVTC
jgi:hypothetical protein